MKSLLLFLLWFVLQPVYSQNGFNFQNDDSRVVIPFQLINNLIFVPFKVNGIELNFLLDTGVSETILFSLEEKKEFRFVNTERIILKGLGSQKSVEGLKSANNMLAFGNMISRNHLLYIVLDPEFNFSSFVGIPVNGIIGYQFFRNNLVEIDYLHKKIIVYKDIKTNRRKIGKKASIIPMSIEKSKPYISCNVRVGKEVRPVKLLIDVGNSDAVWLFQNNDRAHQIPSKNFDDYLGRGFSGDIEGKRAKIASFEVGNFLLNNPIAAFPDSISIKNVAMVQDRMGSVGGEIMRRFKVVFDYTKQQLFLKKNRNYNSPFTYNRSGIDIEHNGLEWAPSIVKLETVSTPGEYSKSGGTKVYQSNFKYNFELKPVYRVAHVRKNSAAAKTGIKSGDILLKINRLNPRDMTLQDINDLLKSGQNKWIILVVQRNNMELTFQFQLDDIL